MGNTGKRLNSVEIQRIRDMVADGSTDKEIGEILGCSSKTVSRHRIDMGIKKTGKGRVLSKPLNPPLEGSILNDTKNEHEKLQNWIDYFKLSPRYKKLIDEFTREELDLFCSQWARYHTQFDDMKPSEEDTLELLITYQLRIRENRKSFKEANEKESEYRKLLGGKKNSDLDLENESERWIYEMVMANNRHKQEINKELKDLQDRHDSLLESLNATRRQREEKYAIGKDTLVGLIRSLNDRDKRAEIGTYNERMKLATKNQSEKMKKPIQFADGTVEPVLLDGADFMKKANKKDD